MPIELLTVEKLNPVDRTPEYFTRKEEKGKISRDCYVSWNGNRYLGPWIYAGREALVTEESTLKIQNHRQIVADLDILPGTKRISRKKEHFEGLLNAVREENITVFETRVETLDLKRYEEVS